MILDTLDPLILEDIQNVDHPSDFIAREDYAVLILRLPEIQNHHIIMHSYAFVIQDETCYLYDRQKNQLNTLGSLKDMNEFLDNITDTLIKEVMKYHYEIEELEESLYDSEIKNTFMQRWLTYKKDVSIIYRLMFHATLTFELFIAHHKRHSTTFEELAYADIYEHKRRIQDLAQEAMDKLDNLYNFYRAKVDERMNKNIYYLTFLSGVFLPLTLMTGFFGMNTGGLPWVQDSSGTWKVVAVSLVLEFVFFLPFLLQNVQKLKRFERNNKQHRE